MFRFFYKKIFLMKNVLFIFCLLSLNYHVFSQNMIDNGDFEQDYEKWNRLTGSNGAMSFYSLDLSVVYDGSQSMRISTKSLGDNPWDNQMVHDGFYPTKGEEYTLRFFASAKDDNVDIKAVIQNTTYMEKSFSISSEWKEDRSEERRVGIECRCRKSLYNYNRKYMKTNT